MIDGVNKVDINSLNGNIIADGSYTVCTDYGCATTIAVDPGYGAGGQVLGWVSPDTPPEPERHNQEFYQYLCDFYFDIDEERSSIVFDTLYDAGSEIDYKQLYEQLRR